MTTLASKDQSGTFAAAVGEVEESRTHSFKRFRLADAPDGRKRFRVGGSIGPVHFRTDPFDETESWKEIDLDVKLTPGKPWDAAVETNGYQVRLWQNRTVAGKVIRYIAQFRRAGKSLTMAPVALVYVNTAGDRQLISRPVAGITPTIDNDANRVTWTNCFGPGIHFRYNLRPDEFFKTVIIDHKTDLPAPTIGLTGLRLAVVLTLAWDAEAANGFGKNQDLSEVTGDDDDGTEDESLADAGDYAHADARGPLWWIKKPRAWDAAGDVPMRMDIRRKGGRVYAICSVTRAAVNGATYPLEIDTAITEEQVGAGMDDGYDYNGSYGSDRRSRTYMIFDDTGATANGLVRFTTVPIPKGVTINSSTMSLRINSYGRISTTFYCENVDSSLDLADPNTIISSRALTTASAATGSLTNLGSVGTWWTTPSLAGPVQEVVNRGGWASNNAMSIIGMDANTGAVTGGCWSTYEEGASYGAKFNCTYTAAAAGSAKTPLYYFKHVGGLG